ncbi:hypothetical protein ATO7_16409 [Oceanococcus atlanticus]|uniref:Lipoprotein n=1 Tax=Oceanococcus atlanticus TaxID=1317117 RepID=A0A1Y1SAI9_9GAMM|nr:hypothetical protein [Oceanococcus atlanticus]ORE84971.1 hypothetical protein ATO7_16409 [Oceanococcus atlanticus]
MKKLGYRLLVGTMGVGLAFLSACGGSESDSGAEFESPIDPGQQPEAVSQLLDYYVENLAGQDASQGSPPEPSQGMGTSLDVRKSNVSIFSGNTFELFLDFDSNSPLSELFVQVVGASEFITLGAEKNSRKAVETVELVVLTDTDIGTGTFCLEISGRDTAGNVSNRDQVCVDVDRELLNALEGNWETNCISTQSGSLESAWTVENADVVEVDTEYSSSDCSGTPLSVQRREFYLGVTGNSTTSDGQAAYEVYITDYTNESRYKFFGCLLGSAGDVFNIGCEEQPNFATQFQREYQRISEDL